MYEKAIVEKLMSLARLDLDASESYDKAIRKIDEIDIKDRLKIHRNDHKRHTDNLTKLIQKYDAESPTITPDIRGVFLCGATTFQSIMGTDGVVRALRTGEEVTNRSYGDSVREDFPQDVLTVLKANFEDEKKHLAYVKELLDTRPWERRKAA